MSNKLEELENDFSDAIGLLNNIIKQLGGRIDNLERELELLEQSFQASEQRTVISLQERFKRG